MNFSLLPALNPGPLTGPGNNTYLLPGPEPLLVDAGVGDPRHLDHLAEALGGAPLARVVVTHHHSDHASGAAAIAARWPGVTLLKMPWPSGPWCESGVAPRAARRPAGQARRPRIQPVFEEGATPPAGMHRRPNAAGLAPRTAWRDGRDGVVWTPLADGDVIPAGGVRLEVVWTPGHAPDHVCLLEPGARVLFGGDLLVARDTVVIPASHGGSLAEYLASLARVRALAPARVLPAHGPAIDDPIALIDRYVEHRRRRDTQILRALAPGPLTPADIVARVYVGLRPELLDFARESVLAHLVKLEGDGRVRRTEDSAWCLVPGA